MTFDKLQQKIHAVSGQVNYQVSKEAKFDTNKQMVDRGITLCNIIYVVIKLVYFSYILLRTAFTQSY